MAFTFAWAGSPDNTSGFSSFSNDFVWSAENGFPAGNVDYQGKYYVKAYSIDSAYATGASGIYTQVWNANGQSGQSGFTFTNPSGNFNHEIHYASGTLHFGRNTAAGGIVTNHADGNTWAGSLCGSMVWATAPWTDGAPSVSMAPGGTATLSWGATSNDGGAPITSRLLTWATDPNFTQNVGSAGLGNVTSTTVSGLKPGTAYYFRVRCGNEVSASPWSGTSSATTLSGGRAWNGSSWSQATIRAWTGSSWVSTNVRVWDGSGWVSGR